MTQLATSTLCFHCGLECPDEKVKIEEKFFCCNGCKTVYKILEENNLCQYYDLEKMISSPDTQILVATINDALVGSGYARIESGKIYNTFEKYAYLGFMFVKSDYRGLGINAKIIENLKDWCLSRDIFELRLDVYHKTHLL